MREVKMNEEKMMILKMLEEGKISADEADELLESVENGGKEEQRKAEGEEASEKKGKFFRIKVTDTETEKTRANIRIPLSILGIGRKLGVKFAPEFGNLDQEQITEAINSGQMGRLLDVYDEEDGEHVEIFIE